ncbi:MAG: NPCBM/NEW2 domain-containing protein, partial [Planctomycetales bacterium]|nr:NPCBM/NEW2 domain-containing protein [Planctomycetales bacterium]
EDGPIAPAFAKALTEPDDEDRIFVRLENSLEPVSGLIESIDDFNVAFDPGDGARKIPRQRVYGVVFALVGRPGDHQGESLVSLADGSTLWGKVASLAEGRLQLKTTDGVAVSAPWDSVMSLKVRSTRMVFLSDLEPTEARHQPLVTLERRWQADRSVGGRTMKLGERTFEKGIGVASRSVLAFANDGGFDQLAAVIGIDAETEGRGDCVFIIEADGRELLRERVRGADPPRAINVDIRGSSRVTLLVETGEDLDLADHADWADVRFLRSDKGAAP